MNPSFSPILWRGTKHLHADNRDIPCGEPGTVRRLRKTNLF
jgi:hypothetical protein